MISRMIFKSRSRHNVNAVLIWLVKYVAANDSLRQAPSAGFNIRKVHTPTRLNCCPHSGLEIILWAKGYFHSACMSSDESHSSSLIIVHFEDLAYFITNRQTKVIQLLGCKLTKRLGSIETCPHARSKIVVKHWTQLRTASDKDIQWGSLSIMSYGLWCRPAHVTPSPLFKHVLHSLIAFWLISRRTSTKCRRWKQSGPYSAPWDVRTFSLVQ